MQERAGRGLLFLRLAALFGDLAERCKQMGAWPMAQSRIVVEKAVRPRPQDRASVERDAGQVFLIESRSTGIDHYLAKRRSQN